MSATSLQHEEIDQKSLLFTTNSEEMERVEMSKNVNKSKYEDISSAIPPEIREVFGAILNRRVLQIFVVRSKVEGHLDRLVA